MSFNTEKEDLKKKEAHLLGSSDDNNDAEWIKVDRRKEKKKKNLLKIGKGKREDYFDVYGPEARIHVEFPEQQDTRLRVEEINGLITWLLADGTNPNWVFVKNKPLISKVVFIIAPGLDSFTFQNYSNIFPNITSIFEKYKVAYSSTSKIDQFQAMRNLLSIPITKKRKEHPTEISQETKKILFLKKFFPNVNFSEKLAAKNGTLKNNESKPNFGSNLASNLTFVHLKPETQFAKHSNFSLEKDKNKNNENNDSNEHIKHKHKDEDGDEDEKELECMESNKTRSIVINNEERNEIMEESIQVKENRFGNHSICEKFIHSLSILKMKKNTMNINNIEIKEKKKKGRYVNKKWKHDNNNNNDDDDDEGNDGDMNKNNDNIDINDDDNNDNDMNKKYDDNINTDLPTQVSQFLLNKEEMRLNNFPKIEFDHENKTMILPQEYVMTIPCPIGKKYHQILAIDCEMCITEEGFELTRATVVDCSGNVLYDKLVVPKNKIKDYNTQYSGITAKMLENVKTSIKDVQRDLLNLIHKETVLVGHSLESDLAALKLVHVRVIDTSVIFPHPRGPPYKSALRVLSERVLSRPIQQKDKGHDSVEDARACMDLVILKLQHGPEFGERTKLNFESLLTQLFECKRSCSFIDRRRFLQQFASATCSAITAESDDDVIKKLEKEVKKPSVDFVCARFADVYSALEQNSKNLDDVASRTAETIAWMTCADNPKIEQSQSKKPRKNEKNEKNRKGLLKKETSAKKEETNFPIRSNVLASLSKFDSFIGTLWNALSSNSVLIIATAHGDVPLVKKLQELKWKRLQSFNTGYPPWNEESEEVLDEFKRIACSSLVFAKAKP